MQKFLSQLFNLVFKLVLAAVGLVFAAFFLLATVVVLLSGFAKWALTGKKPAPFAAFTQFRQFRQRQKGSSSPFSRGSAGSFRPVPPIVSQADVMDVEMREIRVAAPARSDPADVKSQS